MFSIVPNSCLLFSMFWAYADCGLPFLMYLMFSWYRDFSLRLVWPIDERLHVLHFNW